MTRDEIVTRLADLDKQIAEAPHWGAALGAMDEERKELRSELRRLGQAMTPSRTAREIAHEIYQAWMRDERFQRPVPDAPISFFWAELAADAALRASAPEWLDIATAPKDGGMFDVLRPNEPAAEPCWRLYFEADENGKCDDAEHWVVVLGCPEDGGDGVSQFIVPQSETNGWLWRPRAAPPAPGPAERE